MKLAFVVLAHDRPDHLIELMESLVAQGDYAVLHYDLNRPAAEVDIVKAHFDGHPRVFFADRVRCGWGEFSLVQATLNGLLALRAAKIDVDYVYLLSGVDVPIKPLARLKGFLAQNSGCQFIESFPLKERNWIVGGIREERFIYIHWFNERKHRLPFHIMWRVQRALRIRKRVPSELNISLGSQWWCLTWQACLSILEFCEKRPRIVRYFKTVWIPDESFFQTVIRLIVPANKIRTFTLTHYQFTDYGRPVEYFLSHREFLEKENFFFARKIAPSASGLRQYFLKQFNAEPETKSPPVLAGQRSGYYEAIRKPRRAPKSWRRSIGVHYDHSVEEFHFWRGKCAVVFGIVPSELKNSLWHGRLFAQKKIEFIKSAPVFAGYDRSDWLIRNNRPLAFLSNVLAATGQEAGFEFEWDDSEAVRNLAFRLDNFFPLSFVWTDVRMQLCAEIRRAIGGDFDEDVIPDLVDPDLISDCLETFFYREWRIAEAIRKRSEHGKMILVRMPGDWGGESNAVARAARGARIGRDGIVESTLVESGALESGVMTVLAGSQLQNRWPEALLMLQQTVVSQSQGQDPLFHKVTEILSERSYPHILKVKLGGRVHFVRSREKMQAITNGGQYLSRSLNGGGFDDDSVEAEIEVRPVAVTEHHDDGDPWRMLP